MNKTRTSVLFALFIAASLFATAVEANAQKPVKTTPVKLYFWPKDNDTLEMSALVAVTRDIRSTTRIADATFRELLKGVSNKEKAGGLESDYTPDRIVMGGECALPSMKPLLDYYIGMTLKRGVATVNFKEPALCYLNAAISMQDRVKFPMEKTLLQFRTIKEWRIAINGKVFEDWDA